MSPLAGATFNLKKGSNTLSFVKLANEDGSAVYRLAVSTDDAITKTSDLVTPASGHVIVKGLDDDTYTLIETVAPTGYNKLKDDKTVDIVSNTATDTSDNTKQTNITLNYTDNEGSTYGIVNKTGPELPGTGGIGTTVFYVAGTVLVVGAAVMLVAKRRMGAEA